MTSVRGEEVSPTLWQQMLRRKPVTVMTDETGTDTEGGELKRSIGLFQLTLFGVGATIGTGIFVILTDAVPEAGPAELLAWRPTDRHNPAAWESVPVAGVTWEPVDADGDQRARAVIGGKGRTLVFPSAAKRIHCPGRMLWTPRKAVVSSPTSPWPSSAPDTEAGSGGVSSPSSGCISDAKRIVPSAKRR